MANSRFNGLYMAIPTVGIIVLLCVVLMIIIRVWMIGSPKYTRKHVRFPNRFNYPNPDEKGQAKPRYYPPASSYTITRPGGEKAVYSYPVRSQPNYPTMPGYHNYGFQGKAGRVTSGFSTT